MTTDDDDLSGLVRCTVHTRRRDAARCYMAGLADSIGTVLAWEGVGLLAGAGVAGVAGEDVALHDEGLLAAGLARSRGLPPESIDRACGVLRAAGVPVHYATLLPAAAGGERNSRSEAQDIVDAEAGA